MAEKEERRGKEKELIRASFQRGKDVCLQSFYFIDFQSLFEVPDRDDIRFLPCEVAIVEYSLHSGHCKHLHKFIDPGRLTGWAGLELHEVKECLTCLVRAHPNGLPLPCHVNQ